MRIIEPCDQSSIASIDWTKNPRALSLALALADLAVPATSSPKFGPPIYDNFCMIIRDTMSALVVCSDGRLHLAQAAISHVVVIMIDHNS